jgi:ADP-ribose pyrophosphatase YjhB (NUDIX family)
MRTSVAAFALFRRAGPDGRVEYLAQWNDGWDAFHLVGGHKRDGESFRACCAREVAEELGLVEGRDFRLAAERRSHLRYAHWSKRAKAETDYTVELFDAELLGDAARAVEADPRNRWLTEGDIRAGRCRDGRAVSPTMLRILSPAGLTPDAFDGSVGYAHKEVDGWGRPTPAAEPGTSNLVEEAPLPPSPAASGVVGLTPARPTILTPQPMPMPDRPVPVPGVAPVTSPADTPTPLVVWAVAARRHLRQALAEAVGRRGANALDTTMTDLTHRLHRLFPGARAVVVQDQYVGYRRRDNEFILLVEVDGPDRPGRHVVKLAAEGRLAAELSAWESCRPHGLRHDLVFMTLDPCREEDRLVGLLYTDAQQFLGVRPTSLEGAFLGAVCHGTPSPASVADALAALYERVGHLLYPQSFVDDPAGGAFVLDVPRLGSSRDAWSRPADSPARVRQDVNLWASSERGRFRDPVDYLDFICQCVPWLGDPPDGGPAEVRPPDRRPGDPTPGDLVPRMLRGCAHGDLHGRNVLVAVVRDRARWPAVFDYEHMGDRKLLAWDFVKMETELKVRAYPVLFANERARPFIQSVQDFEEGLARQTEACYDGAPWPEVDDGADRAGRLRGLLLLLRRQAALHLGSDRGRPREWLAEYYFALACYGVHAGRFDNLGRPELLGAFVSAGVATARFLWDREGRLGGTDSKEGRP